MKKKRAVFFIIVCIVVMAVFAYSYIKAYNTTITKQFIEEDEYAQSVKKTDIITESTEVVMEIFDVYTQELHETEFSETSVLYNKGRKEVMEYIETLNASITDEQKAGGLINYQLVYFSPENVTIRKNYDTSNYVSQYVLRDENGYIVVYEYPDNTIYHNTGILSIMLDEKSREDLRTGTLIMDVNELYDFLESCSS